MSNDAKHSEQLVENLSNLSVMELCELTRTLEQKWGVKAAPPVAAPVGTVQPGPNPVEAPPAQTEFNVVMKSYAPDKKMPVLKAVREVTGLGLKEMKDFMDSLPKTVKESVSRSEAEDLVNKLREAGAEVVME